MIVNEAYDSASDPDAFRCFLERNPDYGLEWLGSIGNVLKLLPTFTRAIEISVDDFAPSIRRGDIVFID